MSTILQTLDPTGRPATRNPSAASILHKSSSTQSNDIPRNILAFRLITKTLAQIPQTEPFASIDNLRDNGKDSASKSEWKDEDRQEVKISDAFAHLAIAEHDVVAIATNRNSSHRSLEEDPTLGIIACTTPSPPSNSEGLMNATHNTTSLNFFKKAWNIIFAKNAQKKDPGCPHPIITLPDEPIDFKKYESLNAYMKNLEKNW